MTNKDVPIEAVLKWIKQERDKAQAKLDKIVPYARGLEAENAQLREKIEDQRKKIEDLARAPGNPAHVAQIKALQKRCGKLKADNADLLLQLGKYQRKDNTSKFQKIWQILKTK